mgnify:CR=1 FL=1
MLDDDELDTDALRRKYKEEKEKRLKAKAGGARYVLPTGDLAHYDDDPWAPKAITRAPVKREVEVAVIGGGFGGLATAARRR